VPHEPFDVVSVVPNDMTKLITVWPPPVSQLTQSWLFATAVQFSALPLVLTLAVLK